MDIKILAEKYREAREAKKYDLAISACNVAINIDRILSYKSEKIGDPSLLGDLAEILFESGDTTAAEEVAQKAIELVRRVE